MTEPPSGAAPSDRDIRARLEAEIAAFGRLAAATGQGRSSGEVATATLEILRDAAGATAAIALACGDGPSEILARTGFSDAAVQVGRAIADGPPTPLLEQIAHPGVVVSAELDEGPFVEAALAACRADGIGFVSFVGLHVGGSPMGLICLGWPARPNIILSDALLLHAATSVAGAIEHFRLAEQLMKSEARYRTLFERSPEPYIVTDEATVIVEANAAAARLLGLSVEELRGRKSTDFAVIERDEAERRRDIRLRDGRDLVAGFGRRADGTVFPRELEVTQVDIDGETRFLQLIRDLTERQRLQGELVQAQKMETVGILVSGIAHELNNPIAAILGLSELIRRHPDLTLDLRDSADLLVEEADRARRIVGTFLDFIRPRAPERYPTPVRPLLETIRELQSYSQRSGIGWAVEVEPNLPRVAIDRSQMQQVLLNLTTNAIQAIVSDRPSGHLELTAARGPGLDGRQSVRITVTDDGPGVPEALRSRLFVPFFTTKEPGEGTGLGLSVSFDIVRRHEGRLSYEPAPGGRGARFVIDLPVASTVRSQPPPRRSDEPIEPAIGQARPARVLVLDDVESIRTFLGKALRRAGYETVVVADGPTAIEEIRRATVDVVLVDHRMAGMTGIDVYEAIVAIRPELADRWVFMSGDVLNPTLLNFAESRGIRLLAKPFDLATVTATVGEIVDRHGLGD